MKLLSGLNPKKVCYIFSSYEGPRIENVLETISEICPDRSLVYISYKNLSAADILNVRTFSEQEKGVIQCGVTDFMASLRHLYLSALVSGTEPVTFFVPCDITVVFMPQWFNHMTENESEVKTGLKKIFSPEREPPSLHPAHEKSDEKIFQYQSLHKFDDLLGFIAGLEEYSAANLIYAMRSFERVHR